MQIKAAVGLLRQMDGLPMPKPQSSDGKTGPDGLYRPVQDLLEWLWQTFGFQVPLNTYQMDFIFLTVLPCFIKFQSCTSDFKILIILRMKLQTSTCYTLLFSIEILFPVCVKNVFFVCKYGFCILGVITENVCIALKRFAWFAKNEHIICKVAIVSWHSLF